PGERLLPDLEGLGGLRLVAHHLVVVLVGEGEALALAHLAALLVGEPRVLLRAVRLPEVAVDRRERGVGGGELRIELDRALEERDRLDLAAPSPCALAERVGVQGLQRRRRDLLERRGEALDGGEGLAEGAAQAGGHLPELTQHLLLAFDRRLLAGDALPGLAVGGVERQHVVLAQTGDRAVQEGLHTLPAAHLECYL